MTENDNDKKFLDLMDAAEEVLNNEDIHDLKTFYQKLNEICADRRIDGRQFGKSWGNHVKSVREKFYQNGNRFKNYNHRRFAELHRKIYAYYCTDEESTDDEEEYNVTFRAKSGEPSIATPTEGIKRTRTSAPTVYQSRLANESVPLRSVLKETSAAFPNNHRLNHATVPTFPFYSSYRPSDIRVRVIRPTSIPSALKVLPQSPAPSNSSIQSPSLSISNGKNDTSLQQNEDVVLKDSNDGLQNASTDPATVNPSDKLISSNVKTTTPLASAETLAKKSRFESPLSATPSLTVQQSKLYAHLANTEFYDVILVASNGTKISAHRSILSYYSSGFTEIFEKSKEFPVEIPMKDFDVDTIQAALDFMLFKPDSIVGRELALLKFAAKYNISKLMESCTTNADKLEITKSNVVEYVQIAYDYNLEELKEKCLKFFAENKKEIDVDLWKALSNNVFVDLINILHY